MLFFTAVSAFLALGAQLVSANPIAKRADLTGIESVLSTLSVDVHKVTPTLITLQANATESDSSVHPLLDELEGYLDDATTGLNALAARKLAKRQDVNDVQILQANIVTDIVQAIAGINGANIPSLTSYYTDLDQKLGQELTAFFNAAGTITFTKKLLTQTSTFLTQLGFTNSLAALNLS